MILAQLLPTHTRWPGLKWSLGTLLLASVVPRSRPMLDTSYVFQIQEAHILIRIPQRQQQGGAHHWSGRKLNYKVLLSLTDRSSRFNTLAITYTSASGPLRAITGTVNSTSAIPYANGTRLDCILYTTGNINSTTVANVTTTHPVTCEDIANGCKH